MRDARHPTSPSANRRVLAKLRNSSDVSSHRPTNFQKICKTLAEIKASISPKIIRKPTLDTLTLRLWRVGGFPLHR